MLQVATGLNSHSRCYTSSEVIDIQQFENHKVIHCKDKIIKSKYLIVCAGLQADRLAKADDVQLNERVVGFRGDYYELEDHAKHKVRNLIYPVPDPQFPFLGVHFTRMVNGDIECGPNAVFSFKREGYGKTDFSLKDTYDALTYGGTWKLFMKMPVMGLMNIEEHFLKTYF